MNYKIIFVVSAMILTGCASQKIANTKHMDAAVAQQAANSTQTPQQICEAASLAIVTANKEQLHFFAPLHLEQASDNLEDGQDQIKNKETEAEGVKKCFKVKQLVDSGIAMKTKVQSSLSDSLTELAMLKKVDSEKKFSDDIQDYSDDIVDLIKEIEAGKMNEAMQGQANLMKDMLELEIEIVIDKSLVPVEAMIEKADDANADDLAEKTFEKAEKELASAKKFIRSNYRNDQQVKATSELAMRAAKHALYVAKEVETLQNLKPEKAEEKVLYIESLLERINKKFNKDVVIGNSLYEQASIISKRLDAVLDEHASQGRQLAQFTQQAQVVIRKLPKTVVVEEPEPVDQTQLDDDLMASSQSETEIVESGTDTAELDIIKPVETDVKIEAEAEETQSVENDAEVEEAQAIEVDTEVEEVQPLEDKKEIDDSVENDVTKNETNTIEDSVIVP